ncbi:MAG: acyltransferase [Clostridia bacterium]|nr:acyltransferase [Clostridia bacterium]
MKALTVSSGNRDNCLSLIKLIAALQVLWGHAVEHLQLSQPQAVGKLIGYFQGVPIFFIVSGFLIWFSMERCQSVKSFLGKRFWRIYPELWLAVALEIVTIISFYRGWNIKHLALFTITQGTVFQFWTPSSLRGYGCGTPNGTLWTMCVMVQSYIVAWPLHKLFYRKNIKIWIAGLISLIAISVIGKVIVDHIPSDTIIKLYEQTIIRYGWMFFLGYFIAAFKEKMIPVLSRFWYCFLLIGIVPYLTGFDLDAGYHVLKSIFLVCGVVGFAYRFPMLSIKPDISYGIFLYHMIVMNVFITFNLVGSWWYAAGALFITVLLAYASTVTIGKWAAKKKAG